MDKKEMKQSAIDWLVQQVNSDCLNSVFIAPDLINKAKAMERVQIIEAYASGSNDRLKNRINEQYYSETYEGGEK